jgi:hypothetical protein
MPNQGQQIGEGFAFDSAEYCLNQTRAIINDVMEETGGDILTDDWAPTWTYLNIAQRMCQEYLANNGVETNIQEFFIDGITPVTSTDPSTQVWISQSGYFDGTSNHATPHLPANIIIPNRVWERFSGTQNPFVQVTPAQDGLDGFIPQLPYFRQYDWRANMLVLPGATMTNELRVRAIVYFQDLTGPTSVIPYPRMSVALAYMTAYVFANARGDQSAVGLKQDALEQLDNIVSTTIRKKQRRGVSRRPYGGFRRFGWI